MLELPRELVKSAVSWAPSPELGGDPRICILTNPSGDSDVGVLALHFGTLRWTGSRPQNVYMNPP